MKFVDAEITRKTIDGFRLQKLAAHRPINDAIDFSALQISNELKCKCFTQRCKRAERSERAADRARADISAEQCSDKCLEVVKLIYELLVFNSFLLSTSTVIALGTSRQTNFYRKFRSFASSSLSRLRAQPQLLSGTSFRGKHFMLVPRQREMFVNYVGPNELFNAASCVGYSAINFVFTLARRHQHRVYQWF